MYPNRSVFARNLLNTLTLAIIITTPIASGLGLDANAHNQFPAPEAIRSIGVARNFKF
jgi:hypothetical protein